MKKIAKFTARYIALSSIEGGDKLVNKETEGREERGNPDDAQ